MVLPHWYSRRRAWYQLYEGSARHIEAVRAFGPYLASPPSEELIRKTKGALEEIRKSTERLMGLRRHLYALLGEVDIRLYNENNTKDILTLQLMHLEQSDRMVWRAVQDNADNEEIFGENENQVDAPQILTHLERTTTRYL